MTKINTYLLVIIGILLLILSFETCNREKATPENIYNTYQTDTSYIDEKYSGIEKRIDKIIKDLKKTPPKEIYYYQTPNPEKVVIEKIPDSLLVYIDSLENLVKISDKYIKNYPTADKLIDFELNKNLLDITSLNIEGNTKRQKYPLDLNKFNYYWYNNTLNYEIRDKPYVEPTKNIWNQLYINGGFDLLNQAPKAGLDYSLRLKRFRIQTEASTLFLPTGAKLYGEVTLGYRLLR